MFLLMALMTADVIGRYILGKPIPGAFEILQFLLALSVFLALPLVSDSEGHIVVSVLDGFFRGKVRRVQQIAVHALSAIALAIIAWRLWLHAVLLADGQQITGFLKWPIAPLAFAMSALSAFACAAVLRLLWRHLRG